MKLSYALDRLQHWFRTQRSHVLLASLLRVLSLHSIAPLSSGFSGSWFNSCCLFCNSWRLLDRVSVGLLVLPLEALLFFLFLLLARVRLLDVRDVLAAVAWTRYRRTESFK